MTKYNGLSFRVNKGVHSTALSLKIIAICTKIEAARSSETLTDIFRSTRHITEDSKLHRVVTSSIHVELLDVW
jgi:hypothetical protein